MKLFYSPTSPYARKCLALAIEKGIADRIELVAVSPLSDPPALHTANPLGKVPALVLADGRCIVDSPVICEFLDSLPGLTKLIPHGDAARIDCRTREALADGICDAAFSLVMERKRPEAQRSADWTVRWASAIRRSITDFNARVRARAQPDLGDMALACALGYVDFRLGDLGWTADAPALRGWLEAIQTRPSLASTAPPPA